MDENEELKRYKRGVTRRLYGGWLVAFLSLLAIFGWALDLGTGMAPFPEIRYTLILGAGVLVYLFGFRTRKTLIAKDAKKPGKRAELAKILRLQEQRDLQSLAELRKSLESGSETQTNEKTEPRVW